MNTSDAMFLRGKYTMHSTFPIEFAGREGKRRDAGNTLWVLVAGADEDLA